MAYALVSTTAAATIVSPVVKTAVYSKVAQNDAVMFTDEAGVLPIDIRVITNAASGSNSGSESWGYATIRANGSHSSSVTTVAYDEAQSNERLSKGYFVLVTTTGEIMYVLADSGYNSTSGNLTVIRGALGTTASSIADNAYMLVLNTLTLNGATVGTGIATYLSMGKDPKAEMF